MTNVVRRLQEVLQEPAARRVGVVQSTHGNYAQVATPMGLEYVATQGVQYAKKSSVRVSNGTILGRLRDEASLPVYYV